MDLLLCLFAFNHQRGSLGNFIPISCSETLFAENSIARQAAEVGTTEKRVLAKHCTQSFASKDNLPVLVVLLCPMSVCLSPDLSTP